jgi:hypothetical protein
MVGGQTNVSSVLAYSTCYAFNVHFVGALSCELLCRVNDSFIGMRALPIDDLLHFVAGVATTHRICYAGSCAPFH